VTAGASLDRDSGSGRQDILAIILLTLVLVGLPVAVGALAGSLVIPANDDWSYRRIALGLATTGNLRLDGITVMTLVGQILVVQPLLWLSGLQPSAFLVAGVLFAVAATLGAYAFARTLLSSRSAALAAGTLALLPGYLAYDVSFMTDVPAMAAEFACLALGAVAIRCTERRTRWLIASAAAGIFAFSIREFALAAPAAVLLAVLMRDGRRRSLVVLALATAAACAAVYLWRRSLPDPGPPLAAGSGDISQSIRAFSSLALVVAPAALVGALRWRHRIRRRDLAVGFAITAVLLAAPAWQLLSGSGLHRVTLGNPWSQVGSPAPRYLTGLRPLLFTQGTWGVVNGLAIVASIFVPTVGAGIAAAHLRGAKTRRVLTEGLGSPAGIGLLFAVGTAAGMVVYGTLTAVADRYFWPLAVPVAMYFLYRPTESSAERPRRPDPVVALGLAGAAAAYGVILGAVAVVLLLNAAAFNAARWNAGALFVRAGVPADRIDAGYEWVGYHATTPAYPRRPFYQMWWPAFRPCVVISSSPQTLPDERLVGTTTYALRLVTGPNVPLYEYRVGAPGCPSG
jgi:hypothetical protein